jgi:hypothetical protein
MIFHLIATFHWPVLYRLVGFDTDFCGWIESYTYADHAFI